MGVKHGFFEGQHKYQHKQCLGGYLDAYRIDDDLNHVTNLLFIASCIVRAVMSHLVIYLDSELFVWRQGDFATCRPGELSKHFAA